MKKVVIGGILAVVSSIWAIIIGAYVQSNLVTEWYGSLFWSSASHLGVTFPLIVSLIMLALSMVILGIEYFRKDK